MLSISVRVIFYRFPTDELENIRSRVQIDGLMVVTACCGRTRQLIGPCSGLELKSTFDWSADSCRQPMTAVVFKSETIPIHVMQDHITCLKIMNGNIRDHPVVTKLLARQDEPALEVRARKKQRGNATKVTYDDDLRRGRFQYIQTSGEGTGLKFVLNPGIPGNP